MFTRDVRRSLERLQAAKLIEHVCDAWRLESPSNVFAAEEIVAVEAKMTEWGAGFEQALLNRWFASASYLLVPRINKRSSLLQRGCELGIGIRTPDEIIVKSHCWSELPCSYASWLFNEWAWRATTQRP
jgi:hypothetical protein